MTALLPFLAAVAAASAAWLLTRRWDKKRLVASRLAEAPEGALSFPYANARTSGSLRGESLTLDAVENDKASRALFLAGVVSKKEVGFFRTLFKLAWFVPVGLLVFYTLSGTLTVKTAVMAFFWGAFFWFIARTLVKSRREKRKRAILRSLPQFLDLLVVCVEAGLSFPAAIERMLGEVDTKDPLTKEFRLMHHEFLGGLSLGQACERLAKRCDVPDLSLLLSSIVQSETLGASLGSTLRIQARELRDKSRQRMRGRALQIPVKLLFPMMLIFVSLFTMTLGPAFYQLGKSMSGNMKQADAMQRR